MKLVWGNNLTEIAPASGSELLEKQMIYLKRLLFKILKKTPLDMPMVSYWRNKASVQAKVTEEDGVQVMYLEGEKETFPGFPRGYLLYGQLSKLKHEVKNQIFNDAWAKLEKGEPIAEGVKREILPRLYELLNEQKNEIIPLEKMVKPVREIHRALTKVAPEHRQFITLLTHILQEDDAYRFRVQWLVPFFGLMKWFNPAKAFEKSLTWLEHAEVIGDMKERVRLLRRVLLELLKDKGFKDRFNAFFRECKWRKVKMSRADKYFFRGKYFRVDLDKFDY